MTEKKEWKKSTAKATAAAQADESVALANAGKSASTQSGSAGKASRKTAAPVAKVTQKAKPAVPEPESKSSTARKKKAGTTPPETSSIPTAKERSLKNGEIKESAQVLDSQVAFEGPLFRVLRDHLIEPNGRESHRDVIRHNGSVVILAVDHGSEKEKKKKKKDPWIVIERQYRHAAGQYLWELPAGKLEPGEVPLEGAKRELGEETGYDARKWSPLIEYYASPGFLGEAMKVFLAEGLIAGNAHPEEDESIDFRLVRLSEILKMVDKGKIIDGKTLTSILLYARQLGIKRK